VATSTVSPLAAVSVWRRATGGDHVVWLYQSSGTTWEAVRVIGGGFDADHLSGYAPGQLDCPYGLRLSRNGSMICVAEWWNHRASVFRVGDGEFVRHIATGLGNPYDVEEVEGGWLVAGSTSHSVVLVSGDARDALGKRGRGAGEFVCPTALATAPALGLVVRELERVQVFAAPDAIAMAAMSPIRVAWMGAVARTVPRRRRPEGAGAAGQRKRARRAARSGGR
jgi:hypothetical protein